MEYSNENTGVLFRDEKRTNDRAPEYTGKWTDENGKEWRLAAWVKEGKNGKKFFSLKAEDHRVKQGGGANTGYSGGDLDDSIPFAPEWR
jgi:hypothetical protein